MVSSASEPASRAGVSMLERGGNAVDAAVAAAFCLGVTEPAASGLGGQSMALIHLAEPRQTIALDGSSRAPFAVNPIKLPAGPIRIGLEASTVPSTPAALGYMLERYGKLDLGTVLEPAIRAAAEGFNVTPLLGTLVKKEMVGLSRDPLAGARFLIDGRPPAAGHLLVQPELASCLERLARDGWQDFYLGAMADEILADMEERGGLLTVADMRQIPVPQERPVLEGRYRKLRIATFPPPGAGRALVEILNILETFDPDEIDLARPEAHVILAQIFMHALRDRDQRPVDPDLYLQTRRKRMVEKRYAEGVAERIRKLLPPAGSVPPPAGRGETTHMCAADAEGNVVGITQSIELVFGSRRMHPSLGFFYNNYMNTFDYKDMTHPYYLLPGASPWSSVAPTLLFQRRQPLLSLGSPGSERIATSLAQVVTRVVDMGQDLGRAIESPRLHASKAGIVQIEKKRFDPQAIGALERAGFRIRKRGTYSFYLGCVQAIRLPLSRREDFTGVADPRRDGGAMGPGRPGP
jgi:gamma-glutamyltranspeptidase/glutathione hydrolase